jgi:hypothetical protein
VANTPAYYNTAKITAVKSFIVQALGQKWLAVTIALTYNSTNVESLIA